MPNPLTNPLLPSSAIKPLQDKLDTPSVNRSPWEARLRGFGAGALEGLRSLTSPVELAGLATLPLGMGGAAKAAPEAIEGLSRLAPRVEPLTQSAVGMMGRLYDQASPTFKALEGAGKFAGDRTVGGIHKMAKMIPGSEASTYFGPAQETLGEINPWYTPVGGEGMYNIAKKGLNAIPDLTEELYQSVLRKGGR